MSKKFEKEVMMLRPRWRVVSRYYFCMMPVNLMLHGFAWDRSSGGGGYIWRYVFPLFDPAPITLIFGDRLPYPEDFLSMAKGEESAAAAEFISRVAQYEAEVAKLDDLATLLKHIESLNAPRNPWVRRGRALTLIMLGRTVDAAAQLDTLLADRSIDSIPRFREDMSGIANTLSVNPSSAITTLQKWAVKNRCALGLQEDRDSSSS